MTSRARARDGRLAFGDMAAVFRAHRAELVRLAAFILADRGAGEDVVQDVFAQMHARQGKLGDRGQGTPADPLPYLHRAVVNGCRSALRRRRLIRRHAEHDSLCPPLSVEEAALLSEERRQVLAALAALPRRRREVLVLRFYLGLSEAEIAATLGISPGTVKSTAARGLATLADALKETGPVPARRDQRQAWLDLRGEADPPAGRAAAVVDRLVSRGWRRCGRRRDGGGWPAPRRPGRRRR